MKTYQEYSINELLDELTTLAAMSQLVHEALVSDVLEKEANVMAEIKKRFALLEAHQK